MQFSTSAFFAILLFRVGIGGNHVQLEDDKTQEPTFGKRSAGDSIEQASEQSIVLDNMEKIIRRAKKNNPDIDIEGSLAFLSTARAEKGRLPLRKLRDTSAALTSTVALLNDKDPLIRIGGVLQGASTLSSTLPYRSAPALGAVAAAGSALFNARAQHLALTGEKPAKLVGIILNTYLEERALRQMKTDMDSADRVFQASRSILDAMGSGRASEEELMDFMNRINIIKQVAIFGRLQSSVTTAMIPGDGSTIVRQELVKEIHDILEAYATLKLYYYDTVNLLFTYFRTDNRTVRLASNIWDVHKSEEAKDKDFLRFLINPSEKNTEMQMAMSFVAEKYPQIVSLAKNKLDLPMDAPAQNLTADKCYNIIDAANHNRYAYSRISGRSRDKRKCYYTQPISHHVPRFRCPPEAFGNVWRIVVDTSGHGYVRYNIRRYGEYFAIEDASSIPSFWFWGYRMYHDDKDDFIYNSSIQLFRVSIMSDKNLFKILETKEGNYVIGPKYFLGKVVFANKAGYLFDTLGQTKTFWNFEEVDC